MFFRSLLTAKSLVHTLLFIHWFKWESVAGINLHTHTSASCGIMGCLERAVSDMSYCILSLPPTFHQLLKDSSFYIRQKGQKNTQQDFIKTKHNFTPKGIFDSFPLLISFLCSQVPKEANVPSSYQFLASQFSNITNTSRTWMNQYGLSHHWVSRFFQAKGSQS